MYRSAFTPLADRKRPVVECDPADTKTRQEFAKEADANWLIKKYGAGIPLRQVQFGEQVFGVDRLEAIQAVREAQEAFETAPDAVRQKYPTWEAVWSAIREGSFSLPEAPSEAPEPPKEG